MNHCKNCSKCCDVIMLDNISAEDIEQKAKAGTVDPIYVEILKPITREEALLRNEKAVLERESHLVKHNLPKRLVHFYSCPKLVDGRCSEYDRRPTMCSVYPFRTHELVMEWNSNSHSWLSKRQYQVNEPRYSENCTYLPGIIPVVNL